MSENKHPHYSNPQIAEALCEVHYTFGDGHQWKSTAPGDLFKRLQGDYPELEPISEQGVILSVGPDGVPAQQLAPPRLRFKLTHASLPYFLQISDQVFTFNVLSPYPGWQSFKSEMAKRWPELIDVVKPTTVSRIGLRYINRISRLSSDEKPSHWFKESKFVATASLESGAGFLNRMESRLSAQNRVMVTLAHDQRPVLNAKFGSVLLDIDLIAEKSLTTDWSILSGEIDELHHQAWSVFEHLKGPNLERLLNEKRS